MLALETCLQCLPLPYISQITLHSLCAFYKLKVMIKRQKGWQLEGLEWATAMSLSPRGSLCDAPDGVRQCECLTVLLRYNFRNTISFSHLKCTMQWPLGTILSWATIPTVQFSDTSVTPQRPLVHIYSHPTSRPVPVDLPFWILHTNGIISYVLFVSGFFQWA